MIYGKPTKKHRKIMSTPTPLVNVDVSDIQIKPPPRAGSARAKRDLDRVRDYFLKSSRNDKDFAIIADVDLSVPFESFLSSAGLHHDSEYFSQLTKQLKPIILKLKYRFNRPRPWQLDKSISDKVSSTAETPSYPSGHTIQSYVTAGVLSKIYPDHKEKFLEIADRISLSRMHLGYHFPSDITVGKKVASQILRIIDLPNMMFPSNMTLFSNTISESSQSESSKLRVLDFDDTIAKTAERVRVETPDGYKMISPEEFAVYELGKGEYFDPDLAFREFDKVDVKKASPVPLVSDLLKKFVDSAGERKILILTARGDEVKDYVMQFLKKKLSIQNPEERVLFKGVASKDPMDKVRVILEYIESDPGISFVSFFDDSGKNVKAVRALVDALNDKFEKEQAGRKIKGDVRQVMKDEESDEGISLRKPEYEPGEKEDYRKMVRDFLSGRGPDEPEPQEDIQESFDQRSIARDFLSRYS